jgi:LysR family transcriptional regulator, nitrogen assimilation regulatory protein
MLRIAEGGDACALLPLSTTAGAEAVAIRRIEPVISRRAVLRTASDASAPAEAVAAVRTGILTVTHQLAEAGRWPGIRPEGDPR